MVETLLGQGPVAKISGYNLLLLQENLQKVDDQDTRGSKLHSAERLYSKRILAMKLVDRI
ncbi:hypothetical protein Syun_021760 [Stephania yunnanensis]|uniref:Uncharacterized protein n=1 Tax=Stephania yunnanensis TaxID=152371 RepID=A0AAP0IH74_9MAGN